MADLVKRIQSRLSRKSISLSKQDLTREIAALGYSPQALQEEEINTITQLLLDKHQNTELIVSEPEEIAVNPSNEHNATTANSTAITNQQKEQLITVQAQSLGIELSELEITDISQTVSDSFTDFVSAVETINSLIKEYAQSKFDDLEQRIDDSNNNLRDYIDNRTNSLQRKSIEGAITTKEVLEQKALALKASPKRYQQHSKHSKYLTFSRAFKLLSIVIPTLFLIDYCYQSISYHFKYQAYLERKERIQQYQNWMHYQCTEILTEERVNRCEKYWQAEKSGFFKISPPRKTTPW
ncbi:MAG: hypothetical protein HC917_07275 [Richelia sp. SM2_1_7]|nr:hypothetical protein [Richelia sp. SM2_1_7]